MERIPDKADFCAALILWIFRKGERHNVPSDEVLFPESGLDTLRQKNNN